MRPKLTSKVRRWSTGAQVEPLPRIRERYGAELADLVEVYASMLREIGDQPSAQDVKFTLAAIAADPRSVELDRLDATTECELMRVAWSLLRVGNLSSLTADQIAQCAHAARAQYVGASGRRGRDFLAASLMRALLRHLRTPTTAATRRALIEDALRACGLGAGAANIKRLRRKAGQVF